MVRLSTNLAGLLMCLFAALSWGIVLGQWALLGTAELVAVATALMFTAMLLAWPFLTGTRITPHGVQTLVPCRQCGALPHLPTRFCIRCGAYPKAKPA